MSTDELIALCKKQPIGFGCGLLCIILGVAIYYRSGKIAENQAEYEAKSAEAAAIMANVGNSKNLAEQVAEIQALTKELESRLVGAGQLAINQQYFYKLEAENEVKLMDVRQGNFNRSGKANYAGIPFTVSVQGTYKQIMAFLQKLENGRYFCRFNGVTFSKMAGASESSTFGAAGMTLTINLELLGVP